MGRHRTPTNVLDARGSFVTHPTRKRERDGEPVPNDKLGAPPKYFDAAQKSAWRELVKITPDGVLGDSDRWIVEIASTLMAEFRENPPKFNAAKLGRLETIMARIGLSPADRAKISIPKKAKDDDPWGDFE